jgi:hypothetical protein
MNVVGSIAGGSGNLFVFLLQRKFRFSTKKGVLYGAAMTLLPLVPSSTLTCVQHVTYIGRRNLWGAIGAGTQKIGFHSRKCTP